MYEWLAGLAEPECKFLEDEDLAQDLNPDEAMRRDEEKMQNEEEEDTGADLVKQVDLNHVFQDVASKAEEISHLLNGPRESWSLDNIVRSLE